MEQPSSQPFGVCGEVGCALCSKPQPPSSDTTIAHEGPALSARFSVLHLAPGPQPGGDVMRVSAPFEASPFADRAGAPVFPADANYALEVGAYYTDVVAPTLFDYDGDGEAELLFTMQAYVSEGTVSGSVGRIFTFKAGAARRYAPDSGLGWSRVEDIDHDGRPDLVGLYSTVEVGGAFAERWLVFGGRFGGAGVRPARVSTQSQGGVPRRRQ